MISKVKLDFDSSIVESIVPNPKSIPYILKNEVANFYITFRGQLDNPTTISLEYQDSKNNLPFRSELNLNPDSPSESYIDKMSHFKSILALEDSETGGNTEDYIYYVKKVDKKKAIIE